MSAGDIRLNYTRQDLRKATRFTEGDYTGINPRQFYRSLKRSLEEIQGERGFKYQTVGTQGENLEIESEAVGESTGTVNGRLVAASDEQEVGSGTLEYRPYGPHGATALVFGLVLALLAAVAGRLFVAFLFLVVAGAGGYFYFKTEAGDMSVSRQDFIRVLITGEVSERTIETEGESRTDIFANMSVIYAGDSFVNVNTERFAELDWTHRRAITAQVTRWFNQVIDDESRKRDVSSGFVSHLKAWSNRSLQSDVRTVDSLQETMNGDFDYRVAYTNLLLKQLSAATEDELESHQNQLLSELESLAENMNVYVDREGMQVT